MQSRINKESRRLKKIEVRLFFSSLDGMVLIFFSVLEIGFITLFIYIYIYTGRTEIN